MLRVFGSIVLFCVGASSHALAADELSPTKVFQFATEVKTTPFPGPEIDKLAGQTTTPSLRANSATVYQLYVFNPTDRDDSFKVELDTGVKIQTTVTDLPSKNWRLVKFAKPAPAPAAPPAAAPTSPTTPAPEPPPPGTELARTDKGRSVITLRLLKNDGTPVVDDNKMPYGLKVETTTLNPTEYLKVENRDLVMTQKLAQVSFGFSPINPDLPSTLKLSFPKQISTAAPILRDGVYERTLKRLPDTKDAPQVVLKGSAIVSGSTLRADVAVDGVERAFIFEGTTTGVSKTMSQSDKVDVRVFPVSETIDRISTKPVAKFPVRVEVDNPPSDSTLELRVRRQSDSALNETEVIPLGSPRDEHIWLDPSDQGLGFTTRSKDWVKSINLTDTRGILDVSAVLKRKRGAFDEEWSGLLTVTVDATPPEVTRLAFDNLKNDKQLEKGKPLVLSATGLDNDKIAKAVFFIGQPLEDGKLPADAIKADGRLKPSSKGKGKTESDVWSAALMLPADQLGEMTVGVILTDSAGNPSTPEVKRIELVAPTPPPPGGKPGLIEGSVVFGDRPQPGLTVTLADGEGKPKATAKTNDKGKFCFEGIAPGGYKLTVSKTDTTTGMTGSADVTVEANKKANATIELKKKR